MALLVVAHQIQNSEAHQRSNNNTRIGFIPLNEVSAEQSQFNLFSVSCFPRTNRKNLKVHNLANHHR